MTLSIWQEHPDADDLRADAIVIGAGIVGSFTAQLLTARGLDVLHIDARSEPAMGASGRNGGFVLTAQRDPYPMLVERSGRATAREILGHVRRNISRMRELATLHNIPIGPAPVRLAESTPDLRELERWATLFEEDGVPVSFTPGEDPMNAGFLACMRVEGDFVTQPAALTRVIANASGARRLFGAEVFHIDTDHEHGVRVHTQRGVAHAKHLFVAANGYAAALHPLFARLVRPVRGQIIATTPQAPVMPCAGIGHTGYFRQLPDGRILMGGARGYFIDQENTSEDATTPNLQAKLSEYLARWFPDIDPTPERAWSGIQGFTPDRRAIIDALPDAPHIGFALGFSGYGNSIATVAAELMVERVLDGAPTGPFSLEREALTRQ